jgi:hypothetical protein
MNNEIRQSQLRNRQHRASLERLEDRELLTANAAAAAVSHPLAEIAGPTRGVQHFEISIVGTQVSYSPAGLPSDMKGTVYLDNSAGVSVAAIGTYDETLQPIFANVGPGGSPAFVGATGACTFDFNLSRKGGLITLGSITATDTAMIEGALPDGTLLVGSADSPITAATGICQGLTGSFKGQSDVKMGTAFYMHTTVDFTAQDRLGTDMEETLTGLAIANCSVGQSYVNDHWGKSPQDNNSHAALAHLDWLADRYAAADHVFASNSVSPGIIHIPT